MAGLLEAIVGVTVYIGENVLHRAAFFCKLAPCKCLAALD